MVINFFITAVQNKQIKVPNDSALDANKEEESKGSISFSFIHEKLC